MPATVDLTASGNFGAVGEGLFMTGSVAPGPGSFETFVRMQRNGTQQGYNSDAPPQYDEKTSAHHSILLSDVPIVYGDGSGGTEEGVAYREFLFNINEPSGAKRTISLDELQIWQNEAGNLTNFTPDQGFAGPHTNYLAYDLDANGDAWVLLDDDVPVGGAVGDVRILIPDSAFINDASHRYVTLYSKFGQNAAADTASDGGDDDWGLNSVTGNPSSLLSLFESAVVPGGTADQAGEIITYTYELHNVTDAAQTAIVVTDSLNTDLARGVDIVGNNDNVLNVGEVWSYTAHYTVTQADLDAVIDTGEITNTVTADSAETIPVSANSTVVAEWQRGVTLVKTATVADGVADEAGDVISYAIAVTNDGEVTLTQPVVTESTVLTAPVFGAPILGNVELIAPVFSGDYNIGDDNNNGIVEVTDQNGIEDAGETFVFVNAGDEDQNGTQDPGETFLFANVGDMNGNNIQDEGELFQYYNAGDTNQNGEQDGGEDFQFTNTQVVPTFIGGDTDLDGNLDVGETWHYTAPDYVLTQDDIDNRNINGVPTVETGLSHDNTASADNDQNVTDSDTAEVAIVQNPDLAIVKTVTAINGNAAQQTVTAAGQVISYAISVDNTGNMTLTGLQVTDTLDPTVDAVLAGAFNIGDANQDGELDLNETWSFQASYTVQQADIDNRVAGVPTVIANLTKNNTATTDTAQTVPESASVAVPVAQNPDLAIVKTVTAINGNAGQQTVTAAGQVISYAISVDNTGNMTLTGLQVTDTLDPTVDAVLAGAFNIGDANQDGELDTNETWSFQASYAVTQDDIDNRVAGVPTVDANLSQDNTATADTAQTVPENASVAVPIAQDPDIAVTKSAGVTSVDAAGDAINYTVEVENVGNMTLTDVAVDDSLTSLTLASGDLDNDNALDVTETWVYTGSYAATQSDIDDNGGGDGAIDNSVLVTTDQGAAAADSASVAVVQDPAVAVSKTANVTSVDAAGDAINYTVEVENVGNMTLTDVAVDDSLTSLTLASGDLDNDNALDVTETWVYTGTYAATQSDIDDNGGGDGAIDNSVLVTTEEGAAAADSASVAVVRNPAVAVTKTADVESVAAADDLINYTVVVENAGNVTLTGVVVSDSLTPVAYASGDADADDALDVGESWVYTGTYTTLQSDIDDNGGGDGAIDNTAGVTTDQGATGSDDVSVLIDGVEALSVPSDGFRFRGEAFERRHAAASERGDGWALWQRLENLWEGLQDADDGGGWRFRGDDGDDAGAARAHHHQGDWFG